MTRQIDNVARVGSRHSNSRASNGATSSLHGQERTTQDSSINASTDKQMISRENIASAQTAQGNNSSGLGFQAQAVPASLLQTQPVQIQHISGSTEQPVSFTSKIPPPTHFAAQPTRSGKSPSSNSKNRRGSNNNNSLVRRF